MWKKVVGETKSELSSNECAEVKVEESARTSFKLVTRRVRKRVAKVLRWCVFGEEESSCPNECEVKLSKIRLDGASRSTTCCGANYCWTSTGSIRDEFGRLRKTSPGCVTELYTQNKICSKVVQDCGYSKIAPSDLQPGTWMWFLNGNCLQPTKKRNIANFKLILSGAPKSRKFEFCAATQDRFCEHLAVSVCTTIS